jgi:extracellular matrix regulatory protein A
MGYNLLHIGFGNMVVSERVVAVIHPSSAPIKRLKDEARAQGKLVDATEGRKTRAILVMDSDHIVLSAIQPETIGVRFEGRDREGEPDR